jgi:integrase
VFGRITAEQARAIAVRKLGELAAGHDLGQERKDARNAERARLAAPTLQELAEAFLERHSRLHKRTWRGDQHLIGKWVLPHLGASRRAHYRLKQKKVHSVPLAPGAIDILREIKADQEATRAAAKQRGRIIPEIEHLFPGDDGREHLGQLQHTWATVTETAGLQGVRLHDLRHSFASVAVSSGLSLLLVGALLGHASVATTQRYSHLMDSALRQATAAIGSKIQEYAQRPAKVVPLKPAAKP